MFEKLGLPPAKKEKAEQKEKEQLPGFLYEEDGKLITAVEGDADVTEEYESFLKASKKAADRLPPFLYRTGDSILMGLNSDIDVTDKWNSWVKSLKPAVEQEKNIHSKSRSTAF